MDFYKVLSVEQNATKEEIKDSFLKLYMVANQNGLQVPPSGCQALDILSDEDKRAEYDKCLKTGTLRQDVIPSVNTPRIQQQNIRKPAQPCDTIYVRDLPMDITDEELFNIFKPCGIIECITIKTNITSTTPFAYAFVKYAELESAKRAYKEFRGIEVKGSKCRVFWATRPSYLSDNTQAGPGGDNSKIELAKPAISNRNTPQEGEISIEMEVACKHIPVIVGKKWWRKIQIEERTGARIMFPDGMWTISDKDETPVIFQVIGPEDSVKKAKSYINDYIQGKVNPVFKSVWVPRAYFALLRGLKRGIRDEAGCNYIHFGNENHNHRQNNNESCLKFDDSIPRPPPPNLGAKFEIKVCGTPQRIEKAISIIRSHTPMIQECDTKEDEELSQRSTCSGCAIM